MPDDPPLAPASSTPTRRRPGGGSARRAAPARTYRRLGSRARQERVASDAAPHQRHGHKCVPMEMSRGSRPWFLGHEWMSRDLLLRHVVLDGDGEAEARSARAWTEDPAAPARAPTKVVSPSTPGPPSQPRDPTPGRYVSQGARERESKSNRRSPRDASAVAPTPEKLPRRAAPLSRRSHLPR